MSATWEIREGDALERLREMPDESVHCCVTSPPYFGLRDYGVEGQIGLESTPDEFVAALVAVFREVRRALRSDGTLWLNVGDGYAQYDGQGNLAEPRAPGQHGAFRVSPNLSAVAESRGPRRRSLPPGLKRKDLLGIPWLLAFALRADGWYLRSDIIWAKPNPMPESVTDRPTSAHEHVFLLAKSARYFYDADAIKETDGGKPSGNGFEPERLAHRISGGLSTGNVEHWLPGGGRNKRNVWTVATQPYAEAHFATFPPKLVEPCILAGSREGDTILDPFAGAGTTGLVALRHGRAFVGVELNRAYAEMARERIRRDAPLLNTPAEVVAA